MGKKLVSEKIKICISVQLGINTQINIGQPTVVINMEAIPGDNRQVTNK